MKKNKESSYYAIAFSYTGIIIIILSLLLSSCSVTQEINHRQLKIQKQIDVLQAEYYYTLDSLYIEYYKKDKN
tara:strand:+ start:3596 stop:3814 length:219 start_codon:yes stop_codon:yes gene_type:complete